MPGSPHIVSETLLAQLRLVLPGSNDLQLQIAVTLVRASIKGEVLAEIAVERQRHLARERKRLQRERDHGVTERDASVTGGVTNTGHGAAQLGENTGAQPPPEGDVGPLSRDGGAGGALSSGSVRSVADPGPSGSLGVRSERRVRVMSPPVYTPDFEAFWRDSDKEGSKSDAFRAWEQVGRPDLAALAVSRRAWLDHLQGIGVKHIATWLRAFDWQQEPTPRQQALVPRNDPGPRQSKNGAVVAAVLAMNSGGKT